MLNIDSIVKGIVIDHIKPGLGYEIFRLLDLEKANFSVALIMNVDSKKLGKKDIIKVDNKIDMDFAKLGAFDKNLTINIIENGQIKEKIAMKLPKTVKGLIKCKNPRCITMHEKIETKFILLNEEEGIYSCNYCDNLHANGK